MRPQGPGEGQAEGISRDVEMSGLVQKYAERHRAPERLVEHFYRLAEVERRENRWLTRRFWQASLGGALAASLTLAAGLGGYAWLSDRDSPDPYDIVAQEARNLSRLGDALPAAIRERQKGRLDKLFFSFNKDFRYQQKVAVTGESEFVLEGATLREVDGKKIARLAYRTGDVRLFLTVVPMEQNAEWPHVLRKEGWVLLNEESPRTFVWRHGPFIYALVGDLTLERFKEFSAAVVQRAGVEGR
ncbi:MAG: hypothetical protein HYZ11_02780 [Candidatus Tectomicrobia bacterium]|uniref:Uncharacterized protein n=1 Tax=Tectimicrobiota bacterium TaxID=2528274 RepID=A0A932HY16_UNCTE|nr:hypothetical protein [Candidatus Tectomicrobia bacterium]